MFSDHLFTFALSRLTGRFNFSPALPVLFGLDDNVLMVHHCKVLKVHF
ncbi:Uncharacterised protein [Klebsiella pneumoniae]|nr:hypothetical protein AI2667V1_3643 [Klebsiella pneumoniae]CAH3899096.1 hypothetical protein AI2667V1_3643 [Klebsiella pneumoniae]SWP13009.1 Uncharacterised protein [Klebsiella pneumoniae]